MIRPNSIFEREYQAALANSCHYYSTFVVLPTVLGKTVIALRAMTEVLHHDGSKVLMLVPTKPLVEQHASFLRKHLVGSTVVQITGEVPPEQRMEERWCHDVMVSTLQVVDHDLRKRRIDLEGVKFLVLDEAHRAIDRYAYVPIAQAFRVTGGRVLGITASPGARRHGLGRCATTWGSATSKPGQRMTGTSGGMSTTSKSRRWTSNFRKLFSRYPVRSRGCVPETCRG